MLGFLRFFSIERQFYLFVFLLVTIVPLYLWAGFAGSWFSILLVLLFVVKHALMGTVNAAAMKMQYGDWQGAERVLKYTYKPEWLQFSLHGTYYLMKSRIAFEKKEYKEVERLSKFALTLDMQDDFKGMIYLQLINIYGQRKDQRRMTDYLKKAKQLNITQPEIKENINEVELMLQGKHSSQKKMMGRKSQRSMMQQGYMKRGGKKRR